MAASLITQDEWDEWTRQRQARPSLRGTLEAEQPDFSLPPPPAPRLAVTAAPELTPEVGAPSPSPTPSRTGPTGQSATVNQFGDQSLSFAEASAACGPAAAVAFYQQTGRNMTVGEATAIARDNGLWDAQNGMHGPAAQQKLLSVMGVPSKLEQGVDWDAVQRNVAGGNPVIVDSPGHYWQVAGYNPDDGRYLVGESGAAYRGGTAWMTPQEMTARSGAPRSVLYLDNPQTPQPGVAVTEPQGGDLQSYAAGAAQRAGLDPATFVRQIQQESGFNPHARNPSGATGIAQIVPQWHPGVDATDPYASLDYAASLMGSYVAKYGDYPTALAAYNAGPGAVAKYGGVPPFAETRTYIDKILGGQPAPPTHAPIEPGPGAPNLAALTQAAVAQTAALPPYEPPTRPYERYTPPQPRPMEVAPDIVNPPDLLPPSGFAPSPREGKGGLETSYGPFEGAPAPVPPGMAAPSYGFGDRRAELGAPPLPPVLGPPAPSFTPPPFDASSRLAELNAVPPTETIRPAEPPSWQLPAIGPYQPPPLPVDNPISALQNAAARYPNEPLRGLLQGAAEAPLSALAGAGPAAEAGLRTLAPDVYGRPEAALRYQPTPEQIAATQIPLPGQGRRVTLPGFGGEGLTVTPPTGASVSPLELIPPEGLGFGAVVQNVLDPTNLIPGARAGSLADRAAGVLGRGFERAAGIAGREGLNVGARVGEDVAINAARRAAGLTELPVRGVEESAARAAAGVGGAPPMTPALPLPNGGLTRAPAAPAGGYPAALAGAGGLPPIDVARAAEVAVAKAGARDAMEAQLRATADRAAQDGDTETELAARRAADAVRQSPTRLTDQPLPLEPPQMAGFELPPTTPAPAPETAASGLPSTFGAAARGLGIDAARGAVAGAVGVQAQAALTGDQPTWQDYLKGAAVGTAGGALIHRFARPAALREGERAIGAGVPPRPAPPEGFAKKGELIGTTYAQKPNKETYEDLARQYPLLVEYLPKKGGWMLRKGLPSVSVEGYATPIREALTRLEANPRIPFHELSNPEMDRFLARVAENRVKIARGEITPEAMVLSQLLTVGSIRRGAGPLGRVVEGGDFAALTPEQLSRMRPDIQYQIGPAKGQTKGPVMRPEMLWATMAGDPTDPVMMKMLSAIARPDSFATDAERRQAIGEGLIQLYGRATLGGHGHLYNPRTIMGLPAIIKGVPAKTAGASWMETTPALWEKVRAWARGEGEWGDLMGKPEEMTPFSEWSLANSPRGIGATKSNFWPAMFMNPNLATLDGRMRNDVFGLADNVPLSPDEYRYLVEKVHTAVGNDFRYGSQWLPWEFVGGETTTYNALSDRYDDVSRYMRQAESLAKERGVPMGEVMDELSAREGRAPLMEGDSQYVRSRIGVASATIQGLEPGASLADILKVAPELKKVLDQAGVKATGVVSAGKGFWTNEAGEVSSEIDLDLLVQGNRSAVEWVAATLGRAWPQVNGDPQQAVLVSHFGQGTDPIANLVAHGADVGLLDAMGEDLRQHLGGWHIGVKNTKARGAVAGTEAQVFIAGLDEEGQPLDRVKFEQLMTAVVDELRASGIALQAPGLDFTTSTRFIPSEEYDDIIRGGPSGQRVRRAGAGEGGGVRQGPELEAAAVLESERGAGLGNGDRLQLGDQGPGGGAVPGAGAPASTPAFGAAAGLAGSQQGTDEETTSPQERALRGAAGLSAGLLGARLFRGSREAPRPEGPHTMPLPGDLGARATPAPVTVPQLVSWARYNGMLSGPAGRLKDIISSGLAQSSYPLERAAALPFDLAQSKLLGTPRTLYGRQVRAEVTGMAGALSDGWRAAVQTMASGVAPSAVRPDLAAATQEPHAVSVAGRTIPIPTGLRVAGSLPTRFVNANDAFFGTLAAQAAAASIATREAIKEGFTGAELEQRAHELIDHPTIAMAQEAAETRQYRVWQEDGKLNKALGGLRDLPGGSLVIPFVQTPVNLAKYVAERSPLGLAMLVGEHAGAAMGATTKPTTAHTAEMLGRVAVGSTVGFGLYQLAQRGEVSGPPPDAPAERDAWARQGKQPYSIRIGDAWHDYRAWSLSPLLAAAAVTADKVKSGDVEGAGALATTTALAVARAMTDQSFVQGLSNFSAALDDPERRMQSFLNSTATSFVPSALQSLARATDPYVRQPEGNPLQRVGGALAAAVPGLGRLVPERVGAFGQPRARPGLQQGPLGILNPFRSSGATQDPVELELARLAAAGFKVEPTLVGGSIQLGQAPGATTDVALEPGEREQYQTQAGQLAYGQLQLAMGDPSWAAQSDKDKERYIQTVLRGARNAAKERMQPELTPRGIEQYQREQTQRQQRAGGG